MSEQIPIPITIQIEQLGEQIFRARPLGPWNIEVVAGSKDEAERRVTKRLQKAVPKTLPTNLFPFSLPDDHEHWVTSVELHPFERDAAWEESVTIELSSFRWRLENGRYFVRVPALELTLLGTLADVSEEKVVEQARTALMRQTESVPLLQIHHRYAVRNFEYQNIVVDLSTSPEGRSQRSKATRKRSATLRSVASDLTRRKLTPIFELEDQSRELADHLVGENPQSVLLVGPAGVGKSATVHGLVQMRQALGLGDRKVWTTSGARIISGMSGLGMWQQRCSKLIQECNNTKAILHLGSLFELMESGKIDGSPGVASMIRHAISRGKLTAIAECTPEQLGIIERDDPLLLRAFSRIELSEADAPIIKNVLAKSGEYYGHEFSSQSIEELYRLHSRFATYSALPATALRLMRTMLGTRSSDDGVASNRPIEASDVARAFAKQSGLPRFLIDDSIPLDLEKIRTALSKNVIGQTEPINLIVDLVATLKARLVRPGRPLASLMFIGPTGVGKTEMAKAIAKLLYSDTRRMVRIDMSEYSSPWSADKLIGKIGEGDGALTSPIREQPFSVVLLDEFEKADSNVFDLLLQLLGEGRLTDSQGRLADFRNAVVIMTSNLGVDSFKDSSFGFGEDNGTNWREHFQREVRRYVRPEFLGRLDRIVPFQALSKECVRQIAQRELELLRQRSGLKFLDAEIVFDREAISLLSEIGYEPRYGARPLRRAIEEFVTVPLANALSEADRDCQLRFQVRNANGSIRVDAKKLHVKTESEKAKENKTIQTWQILGTLARRSLSSSPLRELENEQERNQRLLTLLEKKLKTAQGPRRIASLRHDAAEAKGHIEGARKLKARLTDVANEVSRLHLDLMLRWYRNENISWPQLDQLAKRQRSLLRQAVEDLMSGRVANSNILSILVVGSDPIPLETLWKAYARVSTDNAWKHDSFLVRPYDPLLDATSAEYRKRQSEKRAPIIKPESKPDLCLTTEGGEESTKLCDLFRPKSHEEFLAQLGNSAGFAMEFHGDGVASWLGNESGTTHFFDPRENGPKRRMRCRTRVAEARITNVEIDEDWREVSSEPARDPIRLFHMESQRLVGPTGEGISFAKGKLSDALVQAIEKEHELALWKAIGFHGLEEELQSGSAEDLELFLMSHN